MDYEKENFGLHLCGSNPRLPRVLRQWRRQQFFHQHGFRRIGRGKHRGGSDDGRLPLCQLWHDCRDRAGRRCDQRTSGEHRLRRPHQPAYVRRRFLQHPDGPDDLLRRPGRPVYPADRRLHQRRPGETLRHHRYRRGQLPERAGNDFRLAGYLHCRRPSLCDSGL